MNNKKERVFAYQIAKAIPKKHLMEMNNGESLTAKQTVQGTGGSGQGMDMQYDLSMDW